MWRYQRSAAGGFAPIYTTLTSWAELGHPGSEEEKMKCLVFTSWLHGEATHVCYWEDINNCKQRPEQEIPRGNKMVYFTLFKFFFKSMASIYQFFSERDDFIFLNLAECVKASGKDRETFWHYPVYCLMAVKLFLLRSELLMQAFSYSNTGICCLCPINFI